MGEREAGGTCALIGSLGVTATCSCFFASEEKLRGNVHYYMYYCSNRRLVSTARLITGPVSSSVPNGRLLLCSTCMFV